MDTSTTTPGQQGVPNGHNGLFDFSNFAPPTTPMNPFGANPGRPPFVSNTSTPVNQTAYSFPLYSHCPPQAETPGITTTTGGMMPGTTAPGLKRPRVDSTATSFEAGSGSQGSPIAELAAGLIPSIGHLNTPASLPSNPGQYFDLSQVINALISRDRLHVDVHQFHRAAIDRASAALEEQKDLQNRLDAKQRALEDRITQLEERIATGAVVGLEGGPKARQKRNVILETAVQNMMRDLVGAKEDRITVPDDKIEGKVVTKQVLILPDPLSDGAEPRKDEGGKPLFNPFWTAPSPLKNSYNMEYLQAVIDRLKNNDSVDCSDDKLWAQVKQYFGTLVGKYKIQISEEHKKKQDAHNNSSKRTQRKQTKLRHRTRVLSAFAEQHNIQLSHLQQFVIYDAMSSEDEGPGVVAQDAWNKKANIRKDTDKAFETLPLGFRATWVTRLYYALDKLAAPNHNTPRFHGFKENTQTRAPKKELPQSMLDDEWVAQLGTGKVKVSKDPEGFDVRNLQIDDDELWPQDLEYLQELEAAYEADEE